VLSLHADLKIFSSTSSISLLYLQLSFKLKTSTYISKASAFFLALVMLFSMTPKKYLHDMVAGHTDSGFAKHTGTASVQQAGFNCGYDHQVVELPFVATAAAQASLPVYFMAGFQPSAMPAQLQEAFEKPENKGPPSFC
jgi:hypothetical protein